MVIKFNDKKTGFANFIQFLLVFLRSKGIIKWGKLTNLVDYYYVTRVQTKYQSLQRFLDFTLLFIQKLHLFIIENKA